MDIWEWIEKNCKGDGNLWKCDAFIDCQGSNAEDCMRRDEETDKANEARQYGMARRAEEEQRSCRLSSPNR